MQLAEQPLTSNPSLLFLSVVYDTWEEVVPETVDTREIYEKMQLVIAKRFLACPSILKRVRGLKDLLTLIQRVNQSENPPPPSPTRAGAQV